MEELEKEINEIAKEKIENQVESLPTEPPKLENLQGKYLNKQVEMGKGVSEIASDFAKASITSDIINDSTGKHDKLRQELAEEQKETLKESFRRDKFKQQAETIEQKKHKAEAFYISFRPILEFDFSNLVRRKEKEEKEQKTYKDRSYGIPLMCLMLCLFVVPYCVVSLMLAILNGINAIFEAVSTFWKIARSIIITLLIFVFACIVVFLILYGIDYHFGTNILKNIKI